RQVPVRNPPNLPPCHPPRSTDATRRAARPRDRRKPPGRRPDPQPEVERRPAGGEDLRTAARPPAATRRRPGRPPQTLRSRPTADAVRVTRTEGEGGCRKGSSRRGGGCAGMTGGGGWI